MTMTSRSFSLPCMHHENTSSNIFYLFSESLPSIFPLHFRCIYFLLYILLSQNCWQHRFQFLTYQKKCIIPSSRNISVIYYSGFLTNELRVASYELRVTIYCTSYELLFTYELRVITYCTSYELFFTYELRVTIYCTNYELFLRTSY